MIPMTLAADDEACIVAAAMCWSLKVIALLPYVEQPKP
jgi:hypothetical protein